MSKTFQDYKTTARHWTERRIWIRKLEKAEAEKAKSTKIQKDAQEAK